MIQNYFITTTKSKKLMVTRRKCFRSLIKFSAQMKSHLYRHVVQIWNWRINSQTSLITKTSDIRKNLINNAASCYASPDCDLFVYRDICSPLMDLTPTSCEEIAGLIKGSPGKSCLLDPIPTWLTKKCIEVLTPVITSIVNRSLSSAVMPADFKEAILLPLLK